ncbi:hypothetical protein FRC03_010630 [Tulasnella sp. 419]|nr:hypothetical protein FRC03_010630 [Tulasnella sp. 419]
MTLILPSYIFQGYRRHGGTLILALATAGLILIRHTFTRILGKFYVFQFCYLIVTFFLDNRHDATRRSDDPPVNITYVFTGVGIDVYVVLWDPPSLGDADTNLTFSIDGSVKGTFARKATVGAPGKFYYNSKVFSIEGLSDQGQHTLVVDLDPSVLILFDRVDVLTGTPDASGGGGTKSSSNLAGIIGGAVGGVVGILAIILGIFFFRRRWRSQQQPENTMEQSMGPRAAYLQPFSPAGAEHKVSPLAQELPWERYATAFAPLII